MVRGPRRGSERKRNWLKIIKWYIPSQKRSERRSGTHLSRPLTSTSERLMVIEALYKCTNTIKLHSSTSMINSVVQGECIVGTPVGLNWSSQMWARCHSPPWPSEFRGCHMHGQKCTWTQHWMTHSTPALIPWVLWSIHRYTKASFPCCHLHRIKGCNFKRMQYHYTRGPSGA